MNDTRQRGVRLSRLKLTAALKDAGLATQAALGERICKLEGHSKSPKNLLSRAFREIPVQVESVERIARALVVPAHTLFLATGDASLADGHARVEPKADERPNESPSESPDRPASDASAKPNDPPAPGTSAADNPSGDGAQPRAGRPAWPWLAAVLVAGLLSALWFSPNADRSPVAGVAFEPLAVTATHPTVAVTSVGGDAARALGEQLRTALAADYRVASRSASQFLGGDANEDSAASRLGIGADILLEIASVEVGRRVGYTAYAATETARRQIFSGTAMAHSLTAKNAQFARDVANALDVALGRTAPPANPAFQSTREALAFYLEGRDHLDVAPRELSIRRAQSSFHAALRIDASDPLAHAGLCEALLEEYWMNDEQRAIRDAEGICAKAASLAPQEPWVRAAQARLLQVTGRNDEALGVYKALLDTEPDDPNWQLGLAVAHHMAYRNSGEATHLASAIGLARRATNNDPDHWKPPFRLGSMLFDDGQLNAAIDATTLAVQRRPSEFALANLGTMHSCAGNFAAAESAYLRADEVSGVSHIDNEMLGQLYYFLHRFEESERFRQQAIDSVASGRPDIHYLWGGLADSLRQQGKTAGAVAAYTEALTIVERDIMSGNQTIDDEAARAYYYSALAKLDSNTVPATVLADVAQALDALAERQIYPAGFRYVALAFALNGRAADAATWVQKAALRCPGYLHYPDFAGLTVATP